MDAAARVEREAASPLERIDAAALLGRLRRDGEGA